MKHNHSVSNGLQQELNLSQMGLTMGRQGILNDVFHHGRDDLHFMASFCSLPFSQFSILLVGVSGGWLQPVIAAWSLGCLCYLCTFTFKV